MADPNLQSGFRGRLMIHIGPHKTGSTTIQRFLAENSDALASEGVLYPHAGRGAIAPEQHWSFGNAVCQGDTEYLRRFVREFEEEATSGSFSSAILSTETLSRKYVKSSHLRTVCEMFPRATRVWIAILRRQDELLSSLYSEHLKQGRLAFPATYTSLSGPEFLDHVRRIELVAGASDGDEIRIAPFGTIKHDLIRVFLSMAGVDGELAGEGETSVSNPSAPARALTFYRYANLLPAHVARRTRKWISKAVGLLPFRSSYSIIPEAYQKSVLMNYLPGNLAIERQLFGGVPISICPSPERDRCDSHVAIPANVAHRVSAWAPSLVGGPANRLGLAERALTNPSSNQSLRA